MNIYEKLNEVRKAVSYLQKDKKVSGGGDYMAITHDAVTAAVREHLVEHGVMIVPHLVKGSTVQTGTTTGKGIPIIRYEATYEICFVNCSDPTDKVCVTMEAHALDQGDKAPGKAISYATKYAMLKLFSIETGDNEEGRTDAKVPKLTETTVESTTITPNEGAGESLKPEQRAACDALFSRMVDMMDSKLIQAAHDAFYALTDPEEQLYVWARLKPHAKFRRAIQDLPDQQRKAA